jgi:hypothetical protein
MAAAGHCPSAEHDQLFDDHAQMRDAAIDQRIEATRCASYAPGLVARKRVRFPA